MVRLESLHMIERACWRELDRATRERDHEWRVATLATVDGERADARSVVLREIDEAARSLSFYTDSRSPKVAQMRDRPDAVLVTWSPRLNWQLRARVTLEVADTGLGVSSHWARVKLSPSAQDYLAALPPGTPVDRYQPERASREFFAVVTAHIKTLDWLELDPQGHRRASFDAEGARWLVP
ncbi:MAG: pyridoxamine 5'-phosphate oxidase family protein [Rubrivivax sp.]|nr:pyridoxamine 5'-phosphate oxidase family protein [Rubrivivax sp.]